MEGARVPSINPFDAYIAKPELAGEIASPAYDALTPQERFQFAEANPRNFLNVIRAVEDFPPNSRPSFEELLGSNAQRLREMIETGLLVYKSQPGFYVYRLAVDEHAQTGLVVEIPVNAYEQGLIKKHEHTQEQKEEELTRYLEVVQAGSSPVCLAYTHRSDIDGLITGVTNGEPLIDFISSDGVSHTLWFVGEESSLHDLGEAFRSISAFYITDGHHRSAAACKYAAKRRSQNPQHTGQESYNYVLAALFPDTHLRILDYNRCVKGMNGHTVEQFLSGLEESFRVKKLDVASAEEARPRKSGQISMFLGEYWYALEISSRTAGCGRAVNALDLTILHDKVLRALLGIEDPRSNSRIEYVSGSFGLDGLVERCREGWDIAFALYPTTMGELMRVSDEGDVMPPKSTWFDPKVRSGLLVRMR